MTDQSLNRFRAARRDYIAAQFSALNEMQRQAVLATEGPLLLLAGAGSGKTTVLIHRIANLIRFGCGSDTQEAPDGLSEEDVAFLENCVKSPEDVDRRRADALCQIRPAAPWSILAITFTNKAANELKERLTAILGAEAQDIWAMTFHSACCRILRREIERLGYTSRFTIYDDDDSERLMKGIIRDMGLDDKTFPPKYVLNLISRFKDKMAGPEDMRRQMEETNDLRLLHVANAYQRYQEQLKENNALDFDDIICLTVQLLQEHEDVRRFYQKKFRYVLVDEYQDTNHAQYLLTALLAGGYENICVVGDDDQSIYSFRGASIENILSFEEHYPAARTIRLEQNYRSTQSILNAANAVISHNIGRKGKRLWTANGAGNPVTVYEAYNEGDEGNFVAGQILTRSGGKNFKDYAILYRNNAMSNALEFALKRNGIPYRVIGGNRFFDRAEVKDMLSYLCVINNRTDDLRLNRIINNPPRGLGQRTLETARRLAQAESCGLYHVIANPNSYGPLESAAGKFNRFTALIEGLAQLLKDGMSLPDFYEELMLRTGYIAMLEDKPSEENKSRLENIRELKSSINSYVENAAEPTLAGFLEEIALYTDIEQYNAGDDAVVMMTMHAAKGLEFPHVFLVGFEDGLFPSLRSISNPREMEEERRLCYVAITRAKQSLTISGAKQRMLYGRTSAALPSRFLSEIPENCMIRKGGYGVRTDYGASRSDTGSEGKQATSLDWQKKVFAAPALQASAYLEVNKGDMVEHTAFGKGMVLSVMRMGNDAMLEIAFDTIGTKKLMARAASAHMKRL